MSELPPGLPSLDGLFGAPLIGLVISSFLSGFVTLQTFFYYRTYPKDKIYLKVLVGIIWLLDSGHLIAITHFVYFYTVSHWGDITVIPRLPISFGINTLFNALITSLSQTFLIFRAHILHGKRWWITIFLLAVLLMHTGAGLGSSVLVLKINLTIVQIHDYQTIASVWIYGAAIEDAIIAVVLFVSLFKKRTFSKALIDRLILFLVGTGVLTSIVAIIDMSLFLILTENLVCLALMFPLGRLYTNALLSSLNARQPLKAMSHPQQTQSSFLVRMSTTADNIVPMNGAKPTAQQCSTSFDHDIPLRDIESLAPSQKEMST